MKIKTLLILFLTLNFAISLKPTDLCIQSQQECKGFYEKEQNYEIKCKPMKCHGRFNSDCKSNITFIQQEYPDSNICSETKNKCKEINIGFASFRILIAELKS